MQCRRLYRTLFFIIMSLSPLIMWAQGKDGDNQLALLYYSQGEFEKAADMYQSLYETTHSQVHFDYLLSCYIELGRVAEAEQITQEQMRRYPKSYYYMVKMAVLYEKDGKQDKASDIYDKVVKKSKKDVESCLEAGQACLDNKADSVARVIYEAGKEKYPDNMQITKHISEIYLRIGAYEQLADAYISLLKYANDEISFVEEQLQFSLIEHRNDALKSILLQKLQAVAQKKTADNVYHELLRWIYMQDRDFASAYTESIFIDESLNQDGDYTYELGKTALSNDEYSVASDCFSYVVALGPAGYYYEQAVKQMLETTYARLCSSSTTPDRTGMEALRMEYLKALDEIHDSKTRAEIIENLAHIEANYLAKSDEAIERLKAASSDPNYRSYRGRLDMELARIYILRGDVWDANLLFASIALYHKNNDLGHEAQLEQAKIAYYNGNFQYAQALLDVLKGSTGKIISNDAFELSQLITDNTALDTTTDALSVFARGDLSLVRRNYQDALSHYDSIPRYYPGHTLEDDILMRKVEIALAQNDTASYVSCLQTVEEKFPLEIYAPKAVYLLAIYYDGLGEAETAKAKYRKLLFEYPGSYYTSEARKRYRELDI